MKKTFKLLSLTLAALTAQVVLAQGVPPDPDIITQVPVDGGIFTVVGSAVAYGLHRLKKNK